MKIWEVVRNYVKKRGEEERNEAGIEDCPLGLWNLWEGRRFSKVLKDCQV